MVGAQNPLARRRRIELAELVNEPWVLPAPPDRVIELVAKEAFRASGLDYPRATVFTASPEVRMESPGDRPLYFDYPGLHIEIFY